MVGAIDGDAQEYALKGGRYTPGVVRVGDTVRRPDGAFSPFVHALLGHLEKGGFTGAPPFLGIDVKGRDIFGFIPGWVPEKFQKFSDEQVCLAGSLLRRFHDATREFGLLTGHRVICHNDPGPNNTVFQNGRPSAFIDFDFAAPGDPIWDIGYMAWSWCVSSRPDRGPAEIQAAQVRILADSYGLDVVERISILAAIMERQKRNIGFWKERSDGIEGLSVTREDIASRVEWSQRELEFTRLHEKAFRAALE